MIRHYILENKITFISVCLLFLQASSNLNAATYNYNYLDVPFASNSKAQAINNFNNIVGTHLNGLNINSAFFYQNSTFSDLAVSETCIKTVFGFSTVDNIKLLPLGLNDSDTIVGKIDTCGKVDGFKIIDGIYDVIRWAQYPGVTQINDINTSGTMVGTVNLKSSSQINFIYNDFYFTKLPHTATAINNSNYIVGDNMIYDSKAYQSTRVLLSGVEWIELSGINNIGQIIGVSFNDAGKIRKSFVYDATGFSVIDYPGSVWTIATGINDQGIVTGWASLPEDYDTITGNYLGGGFSFTAQPTVAPDPLASLPLPVDLISPAISFEDAVKVELSEAEMGSTLIADFNHDGNDDLIMAHTISGKLMIYFGDGSDKSVFNDSKQIAKNGYYSVGYMSSLEKADFNGDGNLDLVIGSQQCNGDNRYFTVAQGNGDGSFTPGACLMMTTHVGFHDSYVYGIAIADFDQDSFQDIVVSTNGNYGAKQVLVYFGYGDMTFSEATEVYSAGVSTSIPYAVHTSDINNDGFIDILVETAKYSSNSMTLYLGNGLGQFPTVMPYQQSWPENWPDMNSDGFPDRLYSVDGKTLIYFGNNTGDFNYMPQAHAFPSISLTGQLRRITGDFNGDGIMDIFVADRNWGENVRGKMYFQSYQNVMTSIPNPIPAPLPIPIAAPIADPIAAPIEVPIPVPTTIAETLPSKKSMDDEFKEFNFKGEITFVTGNSITVNLLNIIITNKTLQIFEDGTLGYLTIGQAVDVQAFQDSKGNMIALEVGVSPI